MAVETHAAPLPAAATGRRREARAGLAMSLATFAMAAASAAQALLYLGDFGVDARTDGFFVAFALYTTFGVFGQSLRLTAAPLLVQPGARLDAAELMRALGLVVLPVLVATGPLAGPLADVLAPGLDEGARSVTREALPVLGCAVVLQLLAAGGATVLAVRSRFGDVAAAYALGAGAGLVAYVVLVPSTEILTLAWSMLAMAVVTAAIMAAGIARSGGLGRPARRGLRAAAGHAGLLLGRTVVYLAFNLLLVVTLAWASRAAPGDATVLSYAYLFASYLVAGTATALGMSRIPEMTRQARAQQSAIVRATVPVGFRYAMLLVAPALAALAAARAPLAGAMFGSGLGQDGAEALRTFGVLLVPWTVAALLVNLLLPLMFATGRVRLVNQLAPPLVALHVVATATGSALGGVDGAVAAFAVAPSAFAAVLVAVAAGKRAPGLAQELGKDAVRFLAAAAAAFAGGAALAGALAGGLEAAVLAGVAGSALYAALLPVVAPEQVTVVAAALRRSRA